MMIVLARLDLAVVGGRYTTSWALLLAGAGPGGIIMMRGSGGTTADATTPAAGEITAWRSTCGASAPRSPRGSTRCVSSSRPSTEHWRER